MQWILHFSPGASVGLRTEIMIGYILVAAVVLSGVWIFFFPGWRRSWLLAKPFPAAWLAIVIRRIGFYRKLQPQEQKQLLDLIRLFIADKQFFGCGGLQINDEIRITIAAEACLLLLNRTTSIYPDLHSILVYPYAFIAAHDKPAADGVVTAGNQGLLGESWQNGKIILSWDDVEKGMADFHDGHNVVLHEFSHQLDSESGSANGLPLMRTSNIKQWAKVFSAGFAALNSAAARHQHSVMDYYGATNAAEFFAVATETFFEKPLQLQLKHPELYAELEKYFKVDPSQWL